MKNKSKLSVYDNEITKLLQEGIKPSAIARKLIPKGSKNKIDSLASRVRKINKELSKTNVSIKTETQTTDYNKVKPKVLSAIGSDGKVMDLDKYCDHYGLDRSMVTSAKFISHTGVPYWNIVFREQNEVDNYDEIFKEVQARVKGPQKNTSAWKDYGRTGYVTISDIHLGAWVRNIDGCPDFDLDILVKKLQSIARRINANKYENVVVFFLGDYLEGVFSKHNNSWQGMENGLYGAEAIITAVETLHNCLLKNINNLSRIYSVSGNHDCLSPNKNDDPDYGAGKLIMKGLEWKGYDVNHKNHVNTVECYDHCFILNHGDHFKSASPESMALRFGKQGKMNVILGGHLHSRAQKTNNSFMDDDSADVRKYTIASVFTGNTYSSNLGFTSTSGFAIFEEVEGQLSFTDITIK